MEKRLLLAVVLMMAVVLMVNVIFPPAPPPPQGEEADPLAAPGAQPPPGPEGAQADRRTEEIDRGLPQLAPVEDGGPPGDEDTVWVSTPLFRLAFAQGGARLVAAEMLQFESLAGQAQGAPVQLVPDGSEDFFTHQWLVGDDTLDLRRARFDISPPEGLEVGPFDGPQSLTLSYDHADTGFRLDLTYTFGADSYVIDLEGRLEGVSARGTWWNVGLGPGLLSNEWNPEEDYKQYLAYVVRGPAGVQVEKIGDIESGQPISLDGPLDWVAVRTKYFASAFVLPAEAAPEQQFARLLVTGLPELYRAQGSVSFQVDRDGRFNYRIYLGPQDFSLLSAVGYGLDRAKPYGYKWLQPVLRPLAAAITGLLVWSHKTLRVGYGWILILFGVGIRVLLFPLYQKSMRSQMATMRVQPLMKEIQEKHKGDPQRLQQEMMKLYREHKINPLGGCLPMMLPMPILFALFFVFRDTIQLRGVPFLWLPDLSQPDPLYIIPLAMGASIFLLQWIGQRGMTQPNPQLKMMMWIMPVVLVVLFLNFASGLNLYYATMNLASLPQQLYLAKERRAAAGSAPPVKPAKAKT